MANHLVQDGRDAKSDNRVDGRVKDKSTRVSRRLCLVGTCWSCDPQMNCRSAQYVPRVMYDSLDGNTDHELSED